MRRPGVRRRTSSAARINLQKKREKIRREKKHKKKRSEEKRRETKEEITEQNENV